MSEPAAPSPAKLTIQAGNCGLTTAIDDEVICPDPTHKAKNDFTNERSNLADFELIQHAWLAKPGASYDRIELSLDRWTSVYLKYENAWRDNRTKAWTSLKVFTSSIITNSTIAAPPATT